MEGRADRVAREKRPQSRRPEESVKGRPSYEFTSAGKKKMRGEKTKKEKEK